MNGKRISCLVLFLGLVLAAGLARAEFPFQNLLTLNRVEADPDKIYSLGEENGPWLIMACSFSGDGCEQQARELVYELRKRYKMEAYLHKMDFEFGEAHGRCFSRYGGLRKARYIRGDESVEIAVLVGNFNDVDDPDTQKTLEKVKTLHPDCLNLGDGKKTNVTLAGWRSVVKFYQGYVDKDKQKRGPMGSAFVIPNPLRPKEYFTPGGVDKLVADMNKNVEHSLLKCPGKYTVQVATFTGKSVLKKESELSDRDLTLQPGQSKLDEAALKAHNLTVALRQKGYEAYEFHEEYASIVTVGSFESVGSPRQDGKIEIDRSVLQIMNTFAGKPLQAGAAPAGANLGMSPQVIAGIPLDVQPKPVMVPKRSIGADYARDSTRNR